MIVSPDRSVVAQAEAILANAWQERSILDLEKKSSNGLSASLLRELDYRAVLAPWWGNGYNPCGGYCATKQEANGMTRVVPVLCGRWGCLVCGPRRQRWLIRQIEAAIPRYDLSYMLVLTCPHRGTRRDAYRRMKRAWNNLLTQLRREYEGLEFIWVMEPHKDGFPHLHVLINKRIDVNWLRPRWDRIWGRSTWFKAVPMEGAGAARYVAKYVTKMARKRRTKGWDFVRGQHLYATSAGITFEPFRKPSTGEYTLLKQPYRKIEREYLRAARVVEYKQLPIPSLVGCLQENWYERAYPQLNGSETWEEWATNADEFAAYMAGENSP